MTSIFGRSTPQNKAYSNQNKGHLGSRNLYMNSWLIDFCGKLVGKSSTIH